MRQLYIIYLSFRFSKNKLYIYAGDDFLQLGEKIKMLRVQHGLTQEELANRCELSKGFISQIERDLTSPSIATLIDILECLGTNLKDFFSDETEEKIVFTQEDFFVKEDETQSVTWLVPSAQKNSMEPIIIRLAGGQATETDDPHEVEEFGYVLSGKIFVVSGTAKKKCRKGECFYFDSSRPHYIENAGNTEATVLWISTPPSF